ncbi:MAG: DNA polymerase III subunit chi [Rhodospirillales bacterium]|nr:DNA polymerase III subunit chi [Rhodospirillales bacterium]
MTDIAFYHLQRSPLERVLPKLLERTVDAGKRALVLAGSDDRAEALAQLLWTYDQDAWMPHGTKKDGSPTEQPIWLSAEDENSNQAQFLFLTDGAVSDHVSEFERCFDMFDGNDDATVALARERWAAYKEAGHKLTYWQQTERGGWEQKAS